MLCFACESRLLKEVTKQESGRRSAPEHSVQCQTQASSSSVAVSEKTTCGVQTCFNPLLKQSEQG